MSKKLPDPDDDEALARAVRDSARQIWQAGLGAFAKAQEEGGSAFTRLVRDGSALQKRAREVEEAADIVGRKASRAVARENRRTGGSWGKLEQVFEDRVARALATIGVPAASEVEALRRRVDELERMLLDLAGRLPPASAPRKRRAAKSPSGPEGGEGA
ncbi:phasin family protein [Massilia sp. G4R7]|uniref:Phasin family protein n=1 Tax=Massilia phyllostachyos TaxID=2898585 RepID=A0ABS8Q655_9BURK|nr:phasin family protein [Massilia phyllostachyos]MCD2516095.1 phasin family protein [Massilia phyllostachyos]